MLNRRSTAIVAALLPVAALLSSCGFDYPTDRVNLIGAGAHNRDALVDVLGARVVAESAGQGRLIGTLVNNDNDAEPTRLESVEGEGVTVEVPEVAVGGNELLNLSGDEAEPVVVSGDFTAGDVVALTFTFSTDESVSLDVPVVKHCGQYEDIELPEASGQPTETDTATETPTDTATEAGAEESDETYLCEHATEAAEDGGH